LSVDENVKELIEKAVRGAALTERECAEVFEAVVAGSVPNDDLANFLVVMAERGETVDELVGAATVLRRHATRINCDGLNAIDTCGTGGDGISTFNVSTAAAIVAAAAGAKVAKHGNCSHTRRSGSAEVMAALGVNVEATPEVISRCIREVGIGFLHAARLHPAVGRVADLRRKIGRRTIFNLLGPLINPAAVHRQVVGVPRDDLIDKIAEALRRLGAVHALVVCGDAKLCDFTVTGASRYVEVNGDRITKHVVAPSDVGLRSAELSTLLVDGPEASAEAIRDVLTGAHGPRRDHTLFNASAALVVAGLANDLSSGVKLAAHAINDGGARRTLDRLVEISKG
jgi:anthranilate phosphoribosyltransferase